MFPLLSCFLGDFFILRSIHWYILRKCLTIIDPSAVMFPGTVVLEVSTVLFSRNASFCSTVLYLIVGINLEVGSDGFRNRSSNWHFLWAVLAFFKIQFWTLISLCSMQNNSPRNLKHRTEGGVWRLNVEGLHTHFIGKTLPLLVLVAMEQRNFTGKCFLCFVEEDFSHIKLKSKGLWSVLDTFVLVTLL